MSVNTVVWEGFLVLMCEWYIIQVLTVLEAVAGVGFQRQLVSEAVCSEVVSEVSADT